MSRTQPDTNAEAALVLRHIIGFQVRLRPGMSTTRLDEVMALFSAGDHAGAEKALARCRGWGRKSARAAIVAAAWRGEVEQEPELRTLLGAADELAHVRALAWRA